MAEHETDTRRPAKLKRLGGAKLAWAVALAAIPLFSIFGRPLQHWALASWGREGLALALALLFAGAGAAFVARVSRNLRQGVFTAALLGLTLAAVIHGVPTVEERLHFLLFGALAYTGGLAFGPMRAAAIALVMAFGDEGLQSLLPERYGDMRDVGMNLLGGVIGLSLFHLRSWLRGDE